MASEDKELEQVMRRFEALLLEIGNYLQEFSARSYPVLLREDGLTPVGIALVEAMVAQRSIREGDLERAERFLAGAEADVERARRSHDPG